MASTLQDELTTIRQTIQSDLITIKVLRLRYPGNRSANGTDRVRQGCAADRRTRQNCIQILNLINRVSHGSHAIQIKRISVLQNKPLSRTIKTSKV